MLPKVHRDLLDAYTDATHRYTEAVRAMSAVPRGQHEDFAKAHLLAQSARQIASCALTALSDYLEAEAKRKDALFKEAAASLYRAQIDRLDCVEAQRLAYEEARRARIEASNAVVEFAAKKPRIRRLTNFHRQGRDVA